MRFERIRIQAFGGLQELDTGDAPLPSWVLVHGENEAGKSSFFEFLTALLYGFYPSSRDRNPWTPWGGGDAAGDAVLRLQTGELLEVHRRLLSSPTGSLVRGSVEEPIRNHTVPAAAHVPLPVFRQVFALGLAELASLDADGWDAVQDRLVGALGARDLRPARTVADELESEAGTLWRPNRRGNQRIRDLRERIGELRFRRSDVREADRRMRDAQAELRRSRELLQARREGRERCQVELERARRLLPVRRHLRRARDLAARAGDPEALDDLPPDPERALAEAQGHHRDAQDDLARLASDESAPRSALDAFTEADRRLLAGEARLEQLAGHWASADQNRLRIAQLDQEVRDLGRRLDTVRSRLDGGADADEEAWLRIPLPRLRDTLRAWTDAATRQRQAEAEDHSDALPPFPRTPLVGAALLGLAGVAVGATAGQVLVLALGAALLAGAATAAGLLWWLRSRRRGATRHEDAQRARRDAERARAQLSEILGDLALLVEGRPVGPELAGDVERIQEILRDLRERRARKRQLAESVEGLGADIAAFVAELPLDDLPVADPGAALHAARHAVRAATRRMEAARAAEGELERLARERRRVCAHVEETERAAHTLRDRLAAFDPEGDPIAGAREARERLDALRRAHEAQAELAELTPDPASWSEEALPDDEQLARLAAREKGLTEEIEELARRVEGLGGEVAHLADRDTLDDLDGEIEILEEECAHLARRRDRLYIMARVVRDADRWIREEHQPGALRRAGRFLSILTGGRYDRLLLGGEDGRTFMVRGLALAEPRPVGPPLSTGTREQVYLALRLALLDELDRSGERLPLFLDEVFVNWDARRRGRGLDLLATAADTRQVFLFTCHDDLAREAEARGAHRLELEAP